MRIGDHFQNSKNGWRNKIGKNKVLDKDLLGGFDYSPIGCMFIPELVNTFIKDRVKNKASKRGCYYHSRDKVYESFCSNPFTKRLEYLGRFKNEDEAHIAWKTRKLELCIEFQERGIIDSKTLELLINYVNNVN